MMHREQKMVAYGREAVPQPEDAWNDFPDAERAAWDEFAPLPAPKHSPLSPLRTLGFCLGVLICLIFIWS